MPKTKPNAAPPAPYQPTPAEAETLAAHDRRRAAQIRRPRLKVTPTATGTQVAPDHADVFAGSRMLAEAMGTADADFSVQLLDQLATVTAKGQKIDEAGLNAAVAVVAGVQPRDEVEAMLAAQMAAVHNLTMTIARRLNGAETVVQQDSSSNALNKLARTFAAQVTALKAYRTGGEQRVVVQHLHVADGGQAVAVAGDLNPGGQTK